MSPAQRYRRTIESLREEIESHRTPSGRKSQRAFCEAYGYERENLRRVLAGDQDISVGLFMRLAANLTRSTAPELPAGVNNWSLRTWLEMRLVDVDGAMYDVNFRNVGADVQETEAQQ